MILQNGMPQKRHNCTNPQFLRTKKAIKDIGFEIKLFQPHSVFPIRSLWCSTYLDYSEKTDIFLLLIVLGKVVWKIFHVDDNMNESLKNKWIY